jgi:hypothetical protein
MLGKRKPKKQKNRIETKLAILARTKTSQTTKATTLNHTLRTKTMIPVNVILAVVIQVEMQPVKMLPGKMPPTTNLIRT